MTGIIVAGMHRSGTSLTARTLASGGWHPGDELLTSPEEEYFEDAAFVALHRSWLGEVVPPGEGHPDWGWSSGGPVDLTLVEGATTERFVAAARAFAAARDAQRDRWLAKDPRASLFLPIWAESTDCRFVVVYRNPWDVVDSAVRLGAEVFCRRPGLVRDAWLDHNRRLVEFVAASRHRCFVMAAESLALDPGAAWEALAGFADLSGPVPTQLVDPQRFIRRDDDQAIAGLYRDLYPDHAAVLDQLDDLAALPRRSPTPRRPADGGQMQAALPGGTLPAGSGVQVVVACRDDGDHLAEALASVEECARHLDRPAIEVTVVDDGSTDGETLRVLDVLRGLGYQVVTTAGVGLAAARNAGAGTSRTAAVIPLDADNRLRPSMVEPLDLVEGGEVDVVHGPWRRFGMDTGVVEPPELGVDALVPGNTVDACAVVRRDLLERIGWWDAELPFWEDWDVWLGVVGSGAATRRLDTVTFDYLVRPDALNTRAFAEPHTRQAVVDRIMAKHRDELGPTVARLVAMVHRFDIAYVEAERQRSELAALLARPDGGGSAARGVAEEPVGDGEA